MKEVKIETGLLKAIHDSYMKMMHIIMMSDIKMIIYEKKYCVIKDLSSCLTWSLLLHKSLKVQMRSSKSRNKTFTN